ncbi:hypothetical protein R9C00_11585 [Flammeovirgaceae bacterium SG7u.111]|nr:hypothetical protein [Flammeovirgaceae bacterium SG7u.132]WPO38094.1 hypothetical protein R9C00_11585 [Flammeovirgaceae bacterium SG7u.111]
MERKSKVIFTLCACLLFILPTCKRELVLKKQDYDFSENIVLIDTIEMHNPAVFSYYKRKEGVVNYCISVDDLEKGSDSIFKYLYGSGLISGIDACCKFRDPYMKGQHYVNEFKYKPNHFVIVKVKKSFYLDKMSGMHSNLRKPLKKREKWLMVAIPFCDCQ